MRQLAWCVMVASVLGITAAASAQADDGSFEDEEARALFQAGRTAFQAGRFDAALKHFEAAYNLSHRPQLLYNIGSAADRLRMDRKALEAFRAYLEQVPDAHNRQEVEARIRVLERSVEPAQPLKPPAEHASSAATAAATTKPPAHIPRETEERPTETKTQAPTPREAAMQSEAAEAAPAGPEPTEEESEGGGVASKWWFWTLIGVVVVGAGVGTGVALAGGGGGGETFVSGDQPGGVTYALGGR